MILRKRRRGPLSPKVVSPESCLVFQDHVYAKRRHDPETIDMILRKRRRSSLRPKVVSSESCLSSQNHVYVWLRHDSGRVDMILRENFALDMILEQGMIIHRISGCIVYYTCIYFVFVLFCIIFTYQKAGFPLRIMYYTVLL